MRSTIGVAAIKSCNKSAVLAGEPAIIISNGLEAEGIWGKMRVGIDAHMIGDHSGGNESYYSNILYNMTIPDGDEYYLFVKKGIDMSPYERGFKIVEFEEKSAFKRNFMELPKLCKKYKLDLLHTQYFIPFNRSCPVICTIHDICFEHYKDIFTKKEYIRQKLLIPYAAKHSTYIFTVSNHAKNDIMEHYHVPEEKVIVTYNAVSDDFRKLSVEELDAKSLRNQFGIKEDYILSVCNLQPRKNLIRLIKAFRKLKENTSCHEQLVIVGKKAWMFNDILKEALSGADDVIFTDYVGRDDLIRLYNDAKIFVYPSFFEGFGIPPLEAMACDTPVAVADATSLPEVVGDAGMYFDPFNVDEMAHSMQKLLRDGEYRDELVKKGADQVKKFSWKESADIITSHYRKI
ncbi:MAG: glycosyltransferase family 4 protein [Acetatifactor sp.]|nr:glycosyltransferase family 4 protein [Acetatifactor sp.]